MDSLIIFLTNGTIKGGCLDLKFKLNRALDLNCNISREKLATDCKHCHFPEGNPMLRFERGFLAL